MKEEDTRAIIRHRLKNAEEALADARYLLDGGRSPQSIVNRSYYAMFYAALAALQTLGQTPSRHEGVLGLFSRQFVLSGKFPRNLGRDLHDTFEWRLRGDYQVAAAMDQGKAGEICQKACDFLEAVKKFLAEQKWL